MGGGESMRRMGDEWIRRIGGEKGEENKEHKEKGEKKKRKKIRKGNLYILQPQSNR
jgi:hypothetical protein